MKSNSLPITNEERDLVFEIADGNHHLVKVIGHMRIISQDAKDVNYMDILRWMKRNGMKGHTFISFLREKHQNSILNAIADLRKSAYSDYKTKKIYGRFAI